jgi:hypothetical protein
MAAPQHFSLKCSTYLLSHDANVLFNGMFLYQLSEAVRTILAELPGKLATAADLLQHTVPLPVAAVAAAAPTTASTPPTISDMT